jgi:hypothetical protein
MDNSIRNKLTDKIEEALICLVSVAGLLVMVLYWK